MLEGAGSCWKLLGVCLELLIIAGSCWELLGVDENSWEFLGIAGRCWALDWVGIARNLLSVAGSLLGLARSWLELFGVAGSCCC